MRKIIIVFLFSIIACKEKYQNIDVWQLNGYWEIEKVITKTGEIKTYKINETIDFIELKDSLQGFRIKVIPQLDGAFRTNDISEKFTIKKQNNNIVFLNYKTDYATWQEELKYTTDSTFSVQNEAGIQYFYKKVK